MLHTRRNPYTYSNTTPNETARLGIRDRLIKEIWGAGATTTTPAGGVQHIKSESHYRVNGQMVDYETYRAWMAKNFPNQVNPKTNQPFGIQPAPTPPGAQPPVSNVRGPNAGRPGSAPARPGAAPATPPATPPPSHRDQWTNIPGAQKAPGTVITRKPPKDWKAPVTPTPIAPRTPRPSHRSQWTNIPGAQLPAGTANPNRGRRLTPDQIADRQGSGRLPVAPTPRWKGFVPNLLATGLSRAMKTEKALGGRPVVDWHPEVGTLVRDGKTQPTAQKALSDHKKDRGGIKGAIKNSEKWQNIINNSSGFVPNMAPPTAGTTTPVSQRTNINLIKVQKNLNERLAQLAGKIAPLNRSISDLTTQEKKQEKTSRDAIAAYQKAMKPGSKATTAQKAELRQKAGKASRELRATRKEKTEKKRNKKCEWYIN